MVRGVKFRQGMDAKTIEIRDRGRFIPAIAIAIEGDRFLTKKAGFGERVILFGALSGGMFKYRSTDWNGDRTWTVAHRWIEQNWEVIPDAEVVDVQYILGETTKPEPSERFS